MDANSNAAAKPAASESSKTIPAHIVERLEAEWRQMRERPAQPQPSR